MGRSFLLGVALGMLILLGGCGRGAAEKPAPSGPAAGPPPVAPPTTPAPGMGSETSTAKTPDPAPGTSPVKPQATDDEAPVPDDLKDFFSLASSRTQSPEADDIPKILEALKHPRTSVRRQAAQTLSYYKTNGETIVPALIVALSDPHQSVGSDAARSLAQFGAAAEPGLPQLRKMLSSDEYFVRSNAINAIAAIGEKAKPAIPDLMKAGDREYTFDDEATEAVGKLGGVKELMALAEDKKDRCRRGAAAGLAQVRPTTPEIVAVLAKMMKDSEPRVRYSAARAFGKAEPKLPEAVPPLLMGLDDAEADVRQAAAGALGGYELEPKTKVQSLLRAMTGSSTGTMLNWEAERSIYQTGPQGLEALIEIVRDEKAKPALRAMAARSLKSADHSGDASEETLITLTRDEALPRNLRCYAASAVVARNRRHREYEALLLDSLKSETDSDVRAYATRGLGQLQSRAALPLLRQILKETTPPAGSDKIDTDTPEGKQKKAADELRNALRNEAIVAIGELGVAAREALPDLLPVMKEDRYPVSDSSVRAVSALCGDNPTPEVLSALIERIADPKGYSGRSNAASALVNFKSKAAPGIPRLVELLKVKDQPNTRQYAVWVLGEIGPESKSALPQILEVATKDDNDTPRYAALEALGGIGVYDAQVGAALDKALDNENLREAAAKSAGKLGPAAKAHVARIAKLLEGEDSAKKIAAEALGQIGPDAKPAVAELVKLTERNDLDLQLLGTVALLRIASDSKEAQAGFARIMEKPENADSVRYRFEQMGEPVIPALVAATKNAPPAVQKTVLESIGRYGPSSRLSRALLEEGAKSDDNALRLSSLIMLGSIPDSIDVQKLVPDLIAALDNEKIRDRATSFLSTIGKPAQPAIAAALLDAKRTEETRQALAESLQQMGRLSRATVATLAEGLKSESAEVRLAAAMALSQVRPPRPEVAKVLLEATGGDDDETIQRSLSSLMEIAETKEGSEALRNPATVERLLKLFEHDNEYVGQSAGHLLQRLSPDEATSAKLIELLKEPRTSQGAANALIGAKPVPAAAVGPLAEAVMKVKRHQSYPFLQALVAVGPEGQKKVLEILQDTKAPSELRRAALDHLSRNDIPLPEVEAILPKLLQDADLPLRLSVAGSLARRKVALDEVFPVLEKSLKDLPGPEEIYYLTNAIQYAEPLKEKLTGPLAQAVIRSADRAEIVQPLLQTLIALAPKSPETLAAAMEALQKIDLERFYQFHRTLAQVDGTAPELLKVFEKLPPQKQLVAIEAFGQLGAKAREAIPVLKAQLASDEAARKLKAAAALAVVDPDNAEAMPILIAALEHPDDNEELVSPALQALKAMGPRAAVAVPVLSELLSSPRFWYDAVDTIGKLGPAGKPAVPKLLEAMKNNDRRAVAAQALGRIGPEAAEAVPALIELLEREQAAHTAAIALGQIGPAAQPAVAKILPRLDDEEERSAALGLIAGLGPLAKEALPKLVGFAKEGDEETRRGAIHAIAGMKSEARPALPLLIGLLEDKESASTAAHALSQIGREDAESMPQVIEALVARTKEGSSIRTDAIYAIGSLGKAGAPALPGLKELAKDSSPEIRQAAVYAIRRLEASNEPPQDD